MISFVIEYFLVCCVVIIQSCSFFFFFNDTATTEIYTLSLHDALPICLPIAVPAVTVNRLCGSGFEAITQGAQLIDRKSTRLNSSHLVISYAVFCLKKKKYNAITGALPIHVDSLIVVINHHVSLLFGPL